jgi:hypothetical protein
METLSTGKMSLPFACMHFWVEEFYEGGPRVRRQPIKWSAIVKSLRNTGLGDE